MIPCRSGLVAGLAFVCISCGGGSSTAPSPTPPPTVTPPPTPTNTWSVAGRLVDTATQQPIAGAQIAPSWDLTPVTTGADGAYQLGAVTNPPANPYKLTVSGSGLLSRELWVALQQGPRSDVTL